MRAITCGVPQESILRPLLFLLFINDFSSVSDTLYSILFADDTNVFLEGKNVDILIDVIQLELHKLNTWLQTNKLTLNLTKTHFMVFHRAKIKNIQAKIQIDNVLIKQVDQTKFLGVIIDHRLDWSNHISYINSKISKGIGIICRANVFLANLY